MNNENKTEFKVPNFNFIGNRNLAFIIAGVLIAVSLLMLVVRGLNFSVDFVGGTELQVSFTDDMRSEIGKIRQVVSELGLGTPEVKLVASTDGQGTEMQITVKSDGQDTEGVKGKITDALSNDFPDNSFVISRADFVGPKVGKELQSDAIKAILLSILVILVYLAFRFKYPYGIASIIALTHDAIICIGLFALTAWEFSIPVLAAILTVVAYSINSTIVIFDRVRENLNNHAIVKMNFEDLVNKSINETFTRNMVTTGSTLMVVLAILFVFFGSGNVLQDFAATLVVGFVAGTFSSLYIACAVLVLWNKKWAIMK